MICKTYGLEMERISQIFVKNEGEKTNTRAPMSWKCLNNHYHHEKYDNLK
ncbi:hypothetical protein [Nitrosopumilus sp.]